MVTEGPQNNQREAAMHLPNAFGKMFHPIGYLKHPSLMDFSYLTENAKQLYVHKTDIKNRGIGKFGVKNKNR